MSYIECGQCGHKALSVATRCPRCGHDLPPQRLRPPEPKPELPRLRPVLLVAGAVVAGVAIVLVARHRAGSSADVVPPAAAPLDTAASLEPQPRPQPPPAGDSTSSAMPAPSARAPAPEVRPAAGQAGRRYARTWVNVREGRGRDTPVIRVLNPGEAVRVDSLIKGWYRVLVDGLPLGYVHRRQLDAVPPPDRP
jgi:hypothetical protein